MISIQKKVRIVFDGGCPACQFYFNIQKLKEDGVDVEFVDVRNQSQLIDSYKQMGINIDSDFVVEIEGARYVGGEAISVLAKMGHRSNFIRKLNYFILKNPSFAMSVYPLLRLGRKILLVMLARKGLQLNQKK